MAIKCREERLGKVYFNDNDFSYSIESNVDENDFILNLKTPLRVQWRITDKCNLNCIHCYANSNFKKNELDEDKLLKKAERSEPDENNIVSIKKKIFKK